MQINIDASAIDRAARQFGIDARRIPGAVREGLNKTAYQARKAERANITRKIDRAKRFTEQSVAVQLAARNVSVDEMSSRVYVLTRMEDIMERLEVGGVEDEGFGISDYGKKFEDRYGSLGRRGIARILRHKRRFIATINGTTGVWERERTPKRNKKRNAKGQGRQDRPLKLIVAFVDRATYDPRLGFVDVGEKLGSDNMADNILDQLKRTTRVIR